MTEQISLGSRQDLAARIQTHLFVISPNNSGSTFVRRAIETCKDVWALAREGQHMLGYTGPDLAASQQELIWAASQENLQAMRDPELYDWEKTKQAWYFQASAKHDAATVFLTKAPPFLMVVDQLQAAFNNSRFIFLNRNPYVVVEAICRYHGSRFETRDKALDTACAHILNCLAVQQTNIEKHRDFSVSFSYEELCADPVAAATQVKQMVAQLSDLNFDQTLSVKGNYHEPLRDMNADQIGRLSAQDIARINQHFTPKAALLAHFGYSLIA